MAAAGAAPSREPVAVIDLGPDATDPAVRQQLGAALVAAGLAPAVGDGLGDALAGIDSPRDAAPLAKALADAQQAFGALDCKATATAARGALSILAARQAAGLPVLELPKAWTYLLLCSDRTGDAATATRAAAQLRALGGSPDIAPALLAKYPDVDALLGAAPVAVDIDTDVPGASVWVDFALAGTAPLHLALPPGEHVIASASPGDGARRGSLVGTPVTSQPRLLVPMPDQSGRWSRIAQRIAGWQGAVPAAAELDAVLVEIRIRTAIVRRGDALEVWGHAGLGERVQRLDQTPRTLAQATTAAALIADRTAGWSDHAPDPTKPLLVEDVRTRGVQTHEHAQWWVYAAIGAAIVAGAIVVTTHHLESDTQTVELHYP